MGDTALDADRLVAETMEATGLDDLGEPTWQDGFERLLDALREEARLNPLGVDIVAGDMRMLLGNRMAIIDWRKEHPEVADGDVVPPVVIVGQARTGTTILYDILAQDLAEPRAADLGGRPSGPATRDRDLPHRSPHRRGRRAAVGRRAAHARLPRHAPDGWAAGRRSASASPRRTFAA